MTNNTTRQASPKPRTFQHFPEEIICPVCGTNDDGETVLIEIDGTADGNIAEAQPVHLACGIAERYRKDMGLFYRKIDASNLSTVATDTAPN